MFNSLSDIKMLFNKKRELIDSWKESQVMLTMFLKTTCIASPTSARMTGPSEPRCNASAVLFFLVMKVSSVYSKYKTFL